MPPVFYKNGGGGKEADVSFETSHARRNPNTHRARERRLLPQERGDRSFCEIRSHGSWEDASPQEASGTVNTGLSAEARHDFIAANTFC